MSVDVAPLSAAVSSGRDHLAAAVRGAGIGFLSAEAATSNASSSSEDEGGGTSSEDEGGGTPCDTCDDDGGGDGRLECEGYHAGMSGDDYAECDANSDHGVRVGLQVCGKKREVDGDGKRTSFCLFLVVVVLGVNLTGEIYLSRGSEGDKAFFFV